MFLLMSICWYRTQVDLKGPVTLKVFAAPSLLFHLCHLFKNYEIQISLFLFSLRSTQHNLHLSFFLLLLWPSSLFPPGQLMFPHYWSIFWFPPIISFSYSPYYIKNKRGTGSSVSLKYSDGQRCAANKQSSVNSSRQFDKPWWLHITMRVFLTHLQ